MDTDRLRERSLTQKCAVNPYARSDALFSRVAVDVRRARRHTQSRAGNMHGAISTTVMADAAGVQSKRTRSWLHLPTSFEQLLNIYRPLCNTPDSENE